MTDRQSQEAGASPGAEALNPLPGELGIPDVTQDRHGRIPRKTWLAITLLVLSLAAMAVLSIQRMFFGGNPGDAADETQKPTAATADPRRLDLRQPVSEAAPMGPTPQIPALLPLPAEAEPIGLRRTDTSPPLPGASSGLRDEDAPVMLVTSRPGAPGVRSSLSPARIDTDEVPGFDTEQPAAGDLQAYQGRLQALLDRLLTSTQAAARSSEGPRMGQPLSGAPLSATSHGGLPQGGPPSGSAGLFGGQLAVSRAEGVAANTMDRRSLVMPKGTAFTCALKTRVISASSGLVGCLVQRNVYGDDGRVLLIERGSHLDGEYRISGVRPGTVRIPVVWTRVRTPLGVTVDLDSPGTGPLGESGIDGYVDNRWMERIGAAMLLSLIDDSVQMVIKNQDQDTLGNTVVLPSTTTNTSRMAEKVLDSTINIPPLVYQNQGGVVGVVVARDVDFSSVYALVPVDPAAAP